MNFKPKTNPLIKHPLVFERWKLPKYSDRDVGFLSVRLFFNRQVVWVIMAVLFWRRLSLAHTMPALCPFPSSLTELPFSSSPTEPALFAPFPPPFVLPSLFSFLKIHQKNSRLRWSRNVINSVGKCPSACQRFWNGTLSDRRVSWNAKHPSDRQSRKAATFLKINVPKG